MLSNSSFPTALRHPRPSCPAKILTAITPHILSHSSLPASSPIRQRVVRAVSAPPLPVHPPPTHQSVTLVRQKPKLPRRLPRPKLPRRPPKTTPEKRSLSASALLTPSPLSSLPAPPTPPPKNKAQQKIQGLEEGANKTSTNGGAEVMTVCCETSCLTVQITTITMQLHHTTSMLFGTGARVGTASANSTTNGLACIAKIPASIARTTTPAAEASQTTTGSRPGGTRII